MGLLGDDFGGIGSFHLLERANEGVVLLWTFSMRKPV